MSKVVKRMFRFLLIYSISFSAFAFIDSFPGFKTYPDSVRMRFMRKAHASQGLGLLIGVGLIGSEGNINSKIYFSTLGVVGVSLLTAYVPQRKFYYKTYNGILIGHEDIANYKDSTNPLHHASKEEKEFLPYFYTYMGVDALMGVYLGSIAKNKLNKAFLYLIPVSSVLLSGLNAFYIDQYKLRAEIAPVSVSEKMFPSLKVSMDF